MKTIKELDYLVGERIKKVQEEKPWHNGIHRLEWLFSDEKDLEGFSIPQLIIVTRKYNILLPTCSTCEAVKPNGKWLPNEGLIRAMTDGYHKRTHGYCNNCLEESQEHINHVLQ